MKRPLLLLALLTTTLAVTSLATVGAVGYGGVGGKPANPVAGNPRTQSIFIYTLKPEQSVVDTVRVYNNTNKQRTITVDAVDSVLASGGSFSCAQAADPKTDVGKWITLDNTSVTVPASSSRLVSFSLRVPAKVSVGEHDGCITTQDASMTQATGSAGVVLSFRSATRVVVTVPGKIIKKLTLTTTYISRTKQGYLVSPVAHNEGNVSLDTNVTVQLKSIINIKAGQQSGKYPVLPRSTASWNFTFKHPFWGGWYRAYSAATYNSNPTAELGINTGSSQTAHITSAVFFVTPTAGGALIELLILAVIALGIGLYIRNQRDIAHIRQHWQNYTVKTGDTVTELAKDRHTSWRRVARANKLKPPYSLKKGQKLRLPQQRGE